MNAPTTSAGDKRSVSTDALETLETLGMIHFRKEERDAIHLAVEPVVAGERLKPGQHIGIVDGAAFAAGRVVALGEELAETAKDIGIVDPFLPADVAAGETFWLVVHPRQISSLRHVWSHPDFPEAE